MQTPDAGSPAGLRVVLNANSAEDYCSSAYTIGFKMLIHEPHLHPVVNSYSHLVPMSHESQVVIEQFLLSGKESIRKVPLKDRKCFFHDENPLEFFRFVLRFAIFTISPISPMIFLCAVFTAIILHRIVWPNV